MEGVSVRLKAVRRHYLLSAGLSLLFLSYILLPGIVHAQLSPMMQTGAEYPSVFLPDAAGNQLPDIFGGDFVYDPQVPEVDLRELVDRADADELHYSVVSGFSTHYGSLEPVSASVYRYSPYNSDFSGWDWFTYEASNGPAAGRGDVWLLVPDREPDAAPFYIYIDGQKLEFDPYHQISYEAGYSPQPQTAAISIPVETGKSYKWNGEPYTGGTLSLPLESTPWIHTLTVSNDATGKIVNYRLTLSQELPIRVYGGEHQYGPENTDIYLSEWVENQPDSRVLEYNIIKQPMYGTLTKSVSEEVYDVYTYEPSADNPFKGYDLFVYEVKDAGIPAGSGWVWVKVSGNETPGTELNAFTVNGTVVEGIGYDRYVQVESVTASADIYLPPNAKLLTLNGTLMPNLVSVELSKGSNLFLVEVSSDAGITVYRLDIYRVTESEAALVHGDVMPDGRMLTLIFTGNIDHAGMKTDSIEVQVNNGVYKLSELIEDNGTGEGYDVKFRLKEAIRPNQQVMIKIGEHAVSTLDGKSVKAETASVQNRSKNYNGDSYFDVEDLLRMVDNGEVIKDTEHDFLQEVSPRLIVWPPVHRAPS
jgi:hypothetical protein